MPLTMARPWQHPKTHFWYLRQRTPLDLVARLKGCVVMLPIGAEFTETRIGAAVQASLRTKDRKAAKALHAMADAALRRFWDAQRGAPTSLTTKQAAALAGTLYAGITATLEDDPGAPEAWAAIQAANEAARAGTYPTPGLTIGPVDKAAEARSFRYGGFADLLLAREGLNVDSESREKLVAAVQTALESATRKLRANAEFDFTPDPAAARFPAWERPQEGVSKAPSKGQLAVDGLFTAWSAFQEGKKAPNTIKRYAASFRSLAAFAKGRDVNSLSGDDLHNWAEHRCDKEGVKAGSVNKNDLVAASSVFKWAMSREGGKRMASNPAVGVSLTETASTQTREKTFRAGEIAAILAAALAVKPNSKNPTAAFAQRWCPWLAAYSGARITELTGLLGSDVRMEGGIPVMDFRKTKTGVPRTVPIHSHLLEQGFLKFARSRGTRPLFFDPERHDGEAATDPAEIRSRKMAQWVRDTVKLDPAVQPDHAWRHTWKTIALGVGIPERISDAITGHSVKSVSRGYEHPPVMMLSDAMKRFPRYAIGMETADAAQ